MKLRLFSGCLALACLSSAHAAVLVTTDNVALAIPDGSSSGLSRNINVSTPSGLDTITSISVSVHVTAAPGKVGFLGDLYIYLTNGSDYAVLYNRAGRSLTMPSGYSDDQSMDVVFSESAANDVHRYRNILTGSSTSPLTSALTGTWQPDGRATDPASVLDTDMRTAGLDSFVGAAADGNWSLFVADLSGGGEHQLVSWTLTMDTVPEPSALLLTLGALPLMMRRRR